MTLSCWNNRDVHEKDVLWMAAYVVLKPACTSINIAFTDIQVTHAIATNKPLHYHRPSTGNSLEGYFAL